MARKGFVGISVVAVAFLLSIPTALFAQSIAGVVRDSSGAVLPGVAVEATSPALIEKVRSVVTDSQGQYLIVDLRPGTYVVTFTLSGFTSVRREGIALTTGFTANVNADMAVGNLAETITVSGASPIVDTRNVRQIAILTDETVAVLPTGRTTTGLAQLIPGISVQEGGRAFQDVGGLLGEGSSWVIHGSDENDSSWNINSMPFYNTSRGNGGGMRADVSQAEEFTLETSGTSAAYREGGVVMNVVMKDGGNAYSGSGFGSYANEHFQSKNLDDGLRKRGLEAVNSLVYTVDVGTSLGGPIKRNRLWFWGNVRHWGTDNRIAGIFHDSNLHDSVYTPDLDRQAVETTWNRNYAFRSTWQANAKNKIQGLVMLQPRKSFTTPFALAGDRIQAPEAQLDRVYVGLGHWYTQLVWSAPLTSRLLVEAGYSYFLERDTSPPRPEVPADNYSITDVGLNIAYNYPQATQLLRRDVMDAYRASVSYVTGSHNFKGGLTWESGTRGPASTEVNHDMTLTLLNGAASSITLQNSPRLVINKLNAMVGAYANDQWTVKRLTLNMGLRFDRHHSSVPAQHIPAGRFIPARDFDEVKNVPDWKDLSPRLSAAYDLFGTGRTALKVSLSRYVSSGAFLALANSNNPVNTTVNNVNRTWTDFNGNFVPECDFLDPAVNGECGRLGNLNFGTQRIVTRYDTAITEGFGVRPYNWETAVIVQHELMPRASVNAGYFRRAFGNFDATDNLLVTPTDYDPFCVTAPLDSRLPGGGGQQMCGFYDLNPSKFGQSDILVTAGKNFGKQMQTYDGVDVSVNARLRDGMLLQGGISSGRTKTDNCFAVDSPQALRPGFCDVHPPFRTQVKLLGSYNLPGNVTVSGTFQTYPGQQILATYTARNAEILPTLHRNLSQGANGTATVELIAPGTMYSERMYQVDARASKIIQLGRTRMHANFDLYNIFNANTVLAMNTTFGQYWQRPLSVLYGRLGKLGLQVDF